MDETEDERLKALMAGLRGSNINDSDFAGSGVRMNLVGDMQCQTLMLHHHGMLLSSGIYNSP